MERLSVRMLQVILSSILTHSGAAPSALFRFAVVSMRTSEKILRRHSGTGLNLRPLFGIGDNIRRFRRGAPTNSVLQAGPLLPSGSTEGGCRPFGQR